MISIRDKLREAGVEGDLGDAVEQARVVCETLADWSDPSAWSAIASLRGAAENLFPDILDEEAHEGDEEE